MTVRDAAQHLEVSQATVYALIAAGRLRHYRIGTAGRGCIRISDEHVEEYLRQAEGGPPIAPPETSPPARRPKVKHVRLS